MPKSDLFLFCFWNMQQLSTAIQWQFTLGKGQAGVWPENLLEVLYNSTELRMFAQVL